MLEPDGKERVCEILGWEEIKDKCHPPVGVSALMFQGQGKHTLVHLEGKALLTILVPQVTGDE